MFQLQSPYSLVKVYICDSLQQVSNNKESLNCLMLSLYTTLYANERYLLLPSVLIVTVTLLKWLLDMQFYMVT